MELLSAAHRVSERPVYRLLASSVLGLVLLTARAAWTGSTSYGFLVWNLFLAWLPLVFSEIVTRLAARGARAPWLLAVGAAWLLFLPNAPYLVTDFIHLRYQTNAPLWFDAVMLMAFAWTGLALGVASLRQTARVVRHRFGRWASAAFVAAAAALSGYGIYLGRFVRLNSWDVVTRPMHAASEVLAPLAHPLTLQRAWTVTGALGLLFLVAYVTLHPEPREARPTSH